MLPQFPQFKPIELSDKEDIEQITHQYPPYSDFNFVSMYSWDVKGEMRVSELNGNLVVKFFDYLSKEPFYSFLGQNNVKDTIEQLIKFSKDNKVGLKLKFISQEIESAHHSSNFIYLLDQDNFDYVYNIKNLYECLGRKYETQRNLINRFKKHCKEFDVKIMNFSDLVKESVLDLDEIWMKNKSLIEEKNQPIQFRNESEALKRIFDLKSDNLFVTCIFVENKLIAFCINELLPNSNYALSHFAKADVSYPGIYSFLLNKNCEFLLKKDKEYLNYEQDLGLSHLRYSKNSFKPEYFLKKYVIIKQ